MICSGRLRSFQGLTFRQVRKNPTFLIKCSRALVVWREFLPAERWSCSFLGVSDRYWQRTVILVLMTHTATD